MTTLLLLTGPAGSGKSTAAAEWASQGTTPRSVIDTDELRWLIRAGAAHPEHGWTGETQRQWDVAMDLWKVMVRVYARYEIDCVIDVYAPIARPEDEDSIMAELGIRRIVLLPTLEVCVARNRARNREHVLSDDALRMNYEGFAWCVRQYRPMNVIDNTDLSVNDTVEAIDAALRKPENS